MKPHNIIPANITRHTVIPIHAWDMQQISASVQRPTTEASEPTAHHQYGIRIGGKQHNHTTTAKA